MNGIICFPGLTLVDYDDTVAPRDWVRIGVNSAIRVIAETARAWLVADARVLPDYRRLVGPDVAWWATRKTADAVSRKGEVAGETKHHVATTAALELAAVLGCTRVFCFGLDCYRTKHEYYFDGSRPRDAAERRRKASTRIRGVVLGVSEQIYQTDALRDAARALETMKAAQNLWDMECWCVGSPYSQQRAIPKLEAEDWLQLVADAAIGAEEAQDTTPGPGYAAEKPPVAGEIAPRRRRGRPPKAARAEPEKGQV